MNTYTCEKCHQEVAIGEWPYCNHGIPNGNLHDFKPYVDLCIADEPIEITSLAQKKRLLRPHWKDDYIIQLQPRDKPDSYYRELNERRAHRKEMAQKEGRP